MKKKNESTEQTTNDQLAEKYLADHWSLYDLATFHYDPKALFIHDYLLENGWEKSNLFYRKRLPNGFDMFVGAFLIEQIALTLVFMLCHNGEAIHVQCIPASVAQETLAMFDAKYSAIKQEEYTLKVTVWHNCPNKHNLNRRVYYDAVGEYKDHLRGSSDIDVYDVLVEKVDKKC